MVVLFVETKTAGSGFYKSLCDRYCNTQPGGYNARHEEWHFPSDNMV
jgi:hypothetical protein